jgi:anaerobic selenocysteine-containing dehydrogenase
MHPRVPDAHVELNPADAARLGIADGDQVKLRVNGRNTSLAARVCAHGRAPVGVALMPRGLGAPGGSGAFAARIEKA